MSDSHFDIMKMWNLQKNYEIHWNPSTWLKIFLVRSF